MWIAVYPSVLVCICIDHCATGLLKLAVFGRHSGAPTSFDIAAYATLAYRRQRATPCKFRGGLDSLLTVAVKELFSFSSFLDTHVRAVSVCNAEAHPVAVYVPFLASLFATSLRSLFAAPLRS